MPGDCTRASRRSSCDDTALRQVRVWGARGHPASTRLRSEPQEGRDTVRRTLRAALSRHLFSYRPASHTPSFPRVW
jgi:hypothetical protein